MRFKFVFSAEWPSLPQCLALCLNIIIPSRGNASLDRFLILLRVRLLVTILPVFLWTLFIRVQLMMIKRSAHFFYAFLKKKGGVGDEFSLRFIIFLLHVMSDNYFDSQGCLYPCAPTSAPPSLNSSSMEAPSAVHYDIRMSGRRLSIVIFVSRIEFLIMIMLYVARSACCGRRGLLHCMRDIACLPLRLVHSLLLLLLLLPPPCSLHNPLRTV